MRASGVGTSVYLPLLNWLVAGPLPLPDNKLDIVLELDDVLDEVLNELLNAELDWNGCMTV